jgi:hypothetical protein
MADEPKPHAWWQTFPAILGGIAALVTAMTGLIVALRPSEAPRPPAVVAPAPAPPEARPATPTLPPPAAPAAPRLPTAITLAGSWQDDSGRTFAIVADASQAGAFEMEQVKPPKEESTFWKAKVKGRTVEIDIFSMPSGSHQGHMELQLSLDGNRMTGILGPGGASPDFPPQPIRFHRVS